MNRKQKEIFLRLVKQHGLQIGQAEDVWNLFGAKIASVIGDPNKMTDGLYDIEKFPIIHIDHLGKFVPVRGKVKYENKKLTEKKEL